MRSIDTAVSGIMTRLKGADASIDEVARLSRVSAGAIWNLRVAESVEDVNMTLRTLRKIEDGLQRLNSRMDVSRDAAADAQ